ncbi:MAG TPA: hypothetical protein VN238_10940 [Solirubrobacteraceae bacterium]|nr:hypothetical protein [Solirubrobacteraceae bacterium]
MSFLVRVPRTWVAFVAVMAVLSVFDVRLDAKEQLTLKVSVSTTTVVLVGFIWLPALIRAFALTGGAIKTPAGEANTGGLVELLRGADANTKLEVLPPVIAALDAVAIESPQGRESARVVRADLEQELAHLHGHDAEKRLAELARAYELIRAEQPPTPARTFRMNELMAEARAAAAAAQMPASHVSRLFAQGTPGARIVALAALEVTPRPEFFSNILDAITNSRSAFEQFHALIAVESLLDELGHGQRRRLRAALDRELSDPEKGLNADVSRRRIIESLLERL